jgi:hypothetical protein
MKSLPRLPQPLAVLVIIGFAACNAGPNVSPNVDSGPNLNLGSTRQIVDRKGTFRAAYSGSYQQSGVCSLTGRRTYNGSGNAKFLHSSSEQLSLTWFCGSVRVIGSAIIASVQHPRDSITASVNSTDFKNPCAGFTMAYTVTGGGGRFRRASGSGTIVVNKLSSRCTSYTYNDKWRGTLKF